MKTKIVRDMTLISLFAAVIAITSFIAIPIGTLPITLQTFGVFATLILLGGRRGSISVAVYVALGAVGLPVFSGFSGGVGRLFDATGGFIFGFLAAALIYWLLSSVLGTGAASVIISAVVAHLSLYAVGAVWFFIGYTGGTGFFEALTLTVLPYLLPDALKLFLAIFLCEKIKKRLKWSF